MYALVLLCTTSSSEPNKGYQAGLAKVPWKEHFQFVLNARSDAVQVKSKLFIEGIRTMTRCLVGPTATKVMKGNASAKPPSAAIEEAGGQPRG